MKRRIRISIAALFSAVMMASLLGFNAVKVSAQPIAWNPPCTATKIVNLTGCAADVTVATNLGNVTQSVAANATALIALGPGTTVTGIVTQAGNFVAVSSPGPNIPPPGPGTPSAGFVLGVTFGPAPGCCFDVYFEQPGTGCYIWLLPPTCIP